MHLLVTGGAGFIGSNFIAALFQSHPSARVTNFDKLTYAANPLTLEALSTDPRYTFCRGDIADRAAVTDLFRSRFDVVVHFAAETHVDRSIEHPEPFLETNVLGTNCLLQAALQSSVRRFIHISTDEVYGDAAKGQEFPEYAALRPSSPYAASKAAADHLVSSYSRTYGLPSVILRPSNNYGPYQFPEKLIPLMILNAREDKPLPLYGDGLQQRDWLYVDDLCHAILLLLEAPNPSPVYNVSSGSPITNAEVVRHILEKLGKPSSLITHVEDRPGHDRRYSVDSSKIRGELGWTPRVSFSDGIARTLDWYLSNTAWLDSARSPDFLRYYERNYTRRSETLKNLAP